MTLEQEIDKSIASEKAAADFYTVVSTLTDDAAVKGFLRGMAEQERRYAKDIEAIANMAASQKHEDNGRKNLINIEQSPEWEQIDVSDMKVGEALRIAVEKERQAASYYASLARSAPGKVSEFFSTMARAKERHAKSLEKRAFQWYKPTVQWKAPWSDK